MEVEGKGKHRDSIEEEINKGNITWEMMTD